MISIFRKHLQGRFLRYTIYIVSFLVIFPASITIFFGKMGLGSGWVVKVNGLEAGVEEYQERERELTQRIALLKQKFGAQAEEKLAEYGLTKDPRELVIDALTMQKLLDSVAKKLDLYVSNAAVAQYMIKQLPREFLLPTGEINRRMVEQAYRMPYAQLEVQLKEQLVHSIVTQLTVGALCVPTFVLKDQYMRDYAHHQFLVASLPLKPFIDRERATPVSDKELADFYAAENRKNKRYFVPEKRAGIVWTFDPDHFGVKLSDNAVTRYYEKHKYDEFVAHPAQVQVRQIKRTFDEKTKADVRAQLEQVRQELLKNPALFEQKARELSQDAASRVSGGLMPFFGRGQHEKVFEQGAFGLAADGAISAIVETSKGFHLLQRVAKKPAAFKPLEQVRGAIEHKLRLEQFNYSFPHIAKRLLVGDDRETALAEFARERGAQKRELPLTSINEQPLIQKLFSTRQGSASVALDNDKGVIVFAAQVHKAYEPTLESIKARVAADYYHARAERALKKLLAQADTITTKAEFERVAREHGAKIEKTEWLNARSGDRLKKLQGMFGSAMGRLFMMNTPGSVVVHISSDAGYIVCLDACAPFDQKSFDEHKNELAFSVLVNQRMAVEQGFVASLCKNATIKVNERIKSLGS